MRRVGAELIERDDARVVHRVAGEPLDHRDRRTRPELFAPGPQDVAVAERRLPLRQPRRREQLVGPGDRDTPIDGHRTGLVEGHGDVVGIVAGVDGAGGPLLAQQFGGDGVGLGAAGVERRDPRGLRRMQVATREFLFDLAAPRREQADQRFGDADDLGCAFADGFPVDAEPAGELVTQMRLVEVAAGLGLPIQRAAVERAPLAVVATGQVRDQDMGVELRVAGPRGAVKELGGDEPVADEVLGAVDTAPRPARLPFHPPERRVDRAVVRLAHLPRDRRVGEGPQHRHRFRGREREVEARDPVFAGLGEPDTGTRVTAFEDTVQQLGFDDAVEVEEFRSAAGPLAGFFAVAEVVVLDTRRDRVEVVALLAGAELRDVQHAGTTLNGEWRKLTKKPTRPCPASTMPRCTNLLNSSPRLSNVNEPIVSTNARRRRFRSPRRATNSFVIERDVHDSTSNSRARSRATRRASPA